MEQTHPYQAPSDREEEALNQASNSRLKSRLGVQEGYLIYVFCMFVLIHPAIVTIRLCKAAFIHVSGTTLSTTLKKTVLHTMSYFD